MHTGCNLAINSSIVGTYIHFKCSQNFHCCISIVKLYCSKSIHLLNCILCIDRLSLFMQHQYYIKCINQVLNTACNLVDFKDNLGIFHWSSWILGRIKSIVIGYCSLNKFTTMDLSCMNHRFRSSLRRIHRCNYYIEIFMSFNWMSMLNIICYLKNRGCMIHLHQGKSDYHIKYKNRDRYRKLHSFDLHNKCKQLAPVRLYPDTVYLELSATSAVICRWIWGMTLMNTFLLN